MKATALALALLALAATAAAEQALPTLDLCGTCKDAASVIHDAVTDPETQTNAVNWVIDNVCPKSTVNKACVDVVNDLAPAVFDWLSASSDPERLCGGAGVCGGSGAALPLAAAAAVVTPDASKRPAANNNGAGGSNGMGCSLCMFVVTKTKDALSDPITRDQVHDATQRACALLPEGPMRDTCAAWARDHEAAIYEYVDGTEPSELCAMLGSCPASGSSGGDGGGDAPAPSAKDAAAPALLPPLSAASVKALAPVVAAVEAARKAGGGGGASNDNCDTCKGVVAEMHSALANPDLQQQVVDTAKAACAALGALADSCRDHVDQYAPMAFGMALAYLQPEQVCRQLHFCPLPPPPPSAAASPLAAAASRVEGLLLLRGGPVARGAAMRGDGPAHFMQA